jgi:hypothetical protein
LEGREGLGFGGVGGKGVGFYGRNFAGAKREAGQRAGEGRKFWTGQAGRTASSFAVGTCGPRGWCGWRARVHGAVHAMWRGARAQGEMGARGRAGRLIFGWIRVLDFSTVGIVVSLAGGTSGQGLALVGWTWSASLFSFSFFLYLKHIPAIYIR